MTAPEGAICSVRRTGSGLWPLIIPRECAGVPAAGGDGGATFDRPKVAKSHRGNTPQNIPFCGGPKDLTPSVAPHRGIPAGCAALAALACPGPSTASLRGRDRARSLPPPKRRPPPSFGRGTGILAAEPGLVSAHFLAILPQLRGSFGTGDAASPAPPGSVPKVGSLVVDRAKIPRPRRRGLRGNMVPFPAALCAAGTPMGWTLVAPFLELPPSCAALAALANRARPAVRCRTALPQKRRDFGGADRPAARGRIFRPRPRRKSPRSARNPRPRRNFPQEAKRKSAPRGAFSLLFSFFRRPGRTSPGR